jgi:ABC-2 type transport system ATP-binding protein
LINYAIETIGLVKRYPTSARIGAVAPDGRPKARGVSSFTAIFNALSGNKRPFIEALKEVNLQIKNGEIFGILGPNGAGKTTLIKILCTLVLRDGGEVYVKGHDPSKEPVEVLKDLQAVLPESRGFNWRLSGRQNLEFYALLYGLKSLEAEQRINYLLDFTGLTDRADDGYQRYSTGMQRRLLLCRALIRDTSIIVFDEPTTGLDPNGAAEFRNLLVNRLARQEGKTILLSTHNLQEAEELCDRIAILDRGKVIACDTPNNIRYLVTERRTVKIVFSGVILGEDNRRLLSEMEEVPGVHGVFPVLNQEHILVGLSIKVEKKLDLSKVLNLIAGSGLNIKSINTEEPSLEEAFMVMTNHEGPNEEEIAREG